MTWSLCAGSVRMGTFIGYVAVALFVAGALWWLLNATPMMFFRSRHIIPIEQTIEKLRTKVANAKSRRDEALANAALFTRDFQAEIVVQQSAKSEAYDDLNAQKDRRASGFNALRRRQDDLSRWHNKSRSTWTGNGRKKIKKDSFFGTFGLEQTMAQKTNAEAGRDSASRQIMRAKAEMDDIYETRIKPAKEALDKIFQDKRRLHEFRKAGQRQHHFEANADEAQREVSDLNGEVSLLNIRIADHITSHKAKPIKARWKEIFFRS